MRGAGVEFVAKALLIATGQESGAGRAAIGTGDVTARETHAVRGDAVDVRSENLLGKALATEFAVAEIITNDDQYIRFALGGVSARGGSKEDERAYEKIEDAETRFHESKNYDLNMLPEGSVWS